MGIIDEAGSRAISGWFKDDKVDNVVHCLSITSVEPPIIIKTKSIQEFATMKILLAKNNIKYELTDISNISKN